MVNSGNRGENYITYDQLRTSSRLSNLYGVVLKNDDLIRDITDNLYNLGIKPYGIYDIRISTLENCPELTQGDLLMNISAIIERAFLEGYATSDFSIITMFRCIGFTALIALYICIVYRRMNKSNFYNRSFHLSLSALSVITAAIILTIQSNIIVSLVEHDGDVTV